jgi:hypothetical protein
MTGYSFLVCGRVFVFIVMLNSFQHLSIRANKNTETPFFCYYSMCHYFIVILSLFQDPSIPANKKPLCGEIAVRGLLKFDIYLGDLFFFLYHNHTIKFAPMQAESLRKG